LTRKFAVESEHLTIDDTQVSKLCRAVKMNLANEGFEARKKEEEVATKKRKAEDDKAWEGECFVIS
jgi:hypothetical protein